MNVAEKTIAEMRSRFDFLLTNCHKYMKKHEPEKFKTECALCPFGKNEEDNSERCGMEMHEVMRIVSMLRGVGFTDRYHLKSEPVFRLRNRYGRIVFHREK